MRIVQALLKQSITDGCRAARPARKFPITQYHRQFLCYLKCDSWTPAAKLPDMPRTSAALLRDGLIEVSITAKGKQYCMTQKGAEQLAAPSP